MTKQVLLTTIYGNCLLKKKTTTKNSTKIVHEILLTI